MEMITKRNRYRHECGLTEQSLSLTAIATVLSWSLSGCDGSYQLSTYYTDHPNQNAALAELPDGFINITAKAVDHTNHPLNTLTSGLEILASDKSLTQIGYSPNDIALIIQTATEEIHISTNLDGHSIHPLTSGIDEISLLDQNTEDGMELIINKSEEILRNTDFSTIDMAVNQKNIASDTIETSNISSHWISDRCYLAANGDNVIILNFNGDMLSLESTSVYALLLSTEELKQFNFGEHETLSIDEVLLLQSNFDSAFKQELIRYDETYQNDDNIIAYTSDSAQMIIEHSQLGRNFNQANFKLAFLNHDDNILISSAMTESTTTPPEMNNDNKLASAIVTAPKESALDIRFNQSDTDLNTFLNQRTTQQAHYYNLDENETIENILELSYNNFTSHKETKDILPASYTSYFEISNSALNDAMNRIEDYGVNISYNIDSSTTQFLFTDKFNGYLIDLTGISGGRNLNNIKLFSSVLTINDDNEFNQRALANDSTYTTSDPMSSSAIFQFEKSNGLITANADEAQVLLFNTTALEDKSLTKVYFGMETLAGFIDASYLDQSSLIENDNGNEVRLYTNSNTTDTTKLYATTDYLAYIYPQSDQSYDLWILSERQHPHLTNQHLTNIKTDIEINLATATSEPMLLAFDYDNATLDFT